MVKLGGARPVTRDVPVKPLQEPSPAPAPAAPQTATQKVLLNEDLLICIFFWLGKSTLARALRVSKVFFHVAARELWSTMDLMTIFSALLPDASLNAIRYNTGNPYTYVLMDHLQRTNLRNACKTRLPLYADFVRRLTISSREPLGLQLAILGEVMAASQAPILPKLRSISLVYSAKSLQIADCLLVPSLVELSIHGELATSTFRYLDLVHEPSSAVYPYTKREVEADCQFFESLIKKVPSLTSIHISGCSSRKLAEGGMANLIANCLERLPHLEIVSTEVIARSKRAMAHLAQSQVLRELSLDVPAETGFKLGEDDLDEAIAAFPDIWTGIATNRGAPPLFPRLEVLRLIGSHSVTFVPWLLGYITSHHLHYLRISPRFRYPDDSARPLMASLLCAGSQLNGLEIVAGGKLPIDFWTALQTLRGLNLRRFGLVIADDQEGYDWDEKLISICDAHPKLRELVYDVGRNADTRNGTNWTKLSCLVLLSQKCRHLQELYIGGLTCENSSTDQKLQDVRSHNLHTLSIRKSDVKPLHLAKFVCAVWPGARVRFLRHGTFVDDPAVSVILEAIKYARRLDAGAEHIPI